VGDHGCEYMTNGTVVILGATGRNFAAGMSGGIAYVLDEDGSFADTRCNKAGVDLEPVFEQKDVRVLENLIRKHVEYTGSPRGEWILENWTEMLPKFVKVFPHELKRALGIPRAAEQAKMPGAVVAAKSQLVQEGAR
jgi:Glutamate synthase domain 3